ncbi:MAG TPA: hypothetical protein V6D10_06025, partial [Trichocoleus sp.]
RVRSFLNPETKRWDAPGLGNSEKRITADQARRMDAIARAIDYQQQVAEAEGTDRLFAQPPANTFAANPTSFQSAQVPKESRNLEAVLGVTF